MLKLAALVVVHLIRNIKMRFILKILAFTALLLISKFTKEDKLITSPAENPQVIVSAAQSNVVKPIPILTSSGTEHHETDLPVEPVKTLVATQATIE
ncbi:hypothetical protein [Pontibacter populi]|uniref:Uncharacterized protein n=1 Tax=Pontibacter populi TaxID=890055 RepID=A0ABV1RVC7_9BACT